jgi:hypothetical protein
MANIKISSLTAATTPLAGTEVLPIVQSGATVKVTVDNLTAGKPVSMTKLTASIPTGTTYHELLADGLLNYSTVGYLTASFNAATVSGSPGVYIGYNSSTGSGIVGPAALGGSPNQGLEIWAFDNVSAFKQVATVSAVTAKAGLTLNLGNLIVQNGNGIDFSDTPGTGTSELFSDYEEGTWTPVFTNCGTGTSITAKYTKVGRLVTINMVFTVTIAVANSSFFDLPIASSQLTAGAFTLNTTQGGFVEVQSGTTCYFASTPTAVLGAFSVSATYPV